MPNREYLKWVLWLRLFISTFAIVCFIGCARNLNMAGVKERTGIRVPSSTTGLHALVEGGYDPRTYIKADLLPADVKTFLAMLPSGSKVKEGENQYGGFDGAPSWWDVVGSTHCILFRAPDAGYGDVEGLISMDSREHPVLYVYSGRGIADPEASNDGWRSPNRHPKTNPGFPDPSK